MHTHRPTSDMYQAIVDRTDAGDAFVLATVLKSTGSAPQKAGAKAVIGLAGLIDGTVGGGAVEARAIELAAEAIRSAQPIAFDFELAGTGPDDSLPICGGSMRILIDPTAARHRAVYAAAADAQTRRQRGVLVTTIQGKVPPQVGVQWLAADQVRPDAGFPGAAAISSALARETAEHFVEDPQAGVSIEALVEPVIPAPQLVIVGGGHVGQAVATQAALVGFEITIIEDRREFAQPDLFPRGVEIRRGDIVATLNGLAIDRDTYIVLVTRGHQHDADALAACIRKPAAYIGMIGSRRKVTLVRESFVASGLASEEEFNRVHAPIGLDIGAITVPEIATSIVAELVAVRRTGGSPQSCRRSRRQ